MSLSILTQGGGGGEFASIFVTGLAETDTVTAAKDGKTVRGKWVQRKNPAYVVPDGYTQFEYIESTGTQIINTNYKVSSNTKVEFKIACLENQPQTYPTLFGVQETASGGNRFGINNSWAAKTGNTAFGPNANLFNVAREGSLENGVFILDGTMYTSTESFTPLDIPMYLFSTNDLENQPTRAALNSASRFYYFKIYEGDTLVKHFVPAKRKSDNVLGMYDAINNTFYTNAGTGSFIAGTETPSIIYGHFISPIKSYGTWAVTATNGEKTKTQDVLVDAAVEYEIEMSYVLWLYRDGEEFEDVTGGWTGYKRTAQKQVGGFQTNKEIDLTPYTTMHVVICTNSTCYSGLGTKVDTSASDFSTWLYKNIQFHETGESETVPTEFVYDISSLAQKKGYFFIGSLGNAGGTYTMTTDKNSDHFYTRMKNSSYDYWDKIYEVWFE